MDIESSANEIGKMADLLISILGLSAYPVGVSLLPPGSEIPKDAEVLHQHRYCQALMKARSGKSVILDADGISCPAAASAFGFRPLPEQLAGGKGLIGFGIVENELIGRKMFEGMSRLESGSVALLHLYPLQIADSFPDVVIVEDEPEKLMWIALSYLHATGGERVQGSTAVLQATCVDSTIIPYLENRLNYGLGCYGCRDATDISSNETVLGFPGKALPAIIEHLQYLGTKAIPRSRAKGAYGTLTRVEGTADSKSEADCDALGTG